MPAEGRGTPARNRRAGTETIERFLSFAERKTSCLAVALLHVHAKGMGFVGYAGSSRAVEAMERGSSCEDRNAEFARVVSWQKTRQHEPSPC